MKISKRFHMKLSDIFKTKLTNFCKNSNVFEQNYENFE